MLQVRVCQSDAAFNIAPGPGTHLSLQSSLHPMDRKLRKFIVEAFFKHKETALIKCQLLQSQFSGPALCVRDYGRVQDLPLLLHTRLLLFFFPESFQLKLDAVRPALCSSLL